MSDNNTLEAQLKKKLDSGEIGEEEYQELMKKFGDLDLLSSKVDKKTKKTRPKWRFTGSRSVKGDDVNEPVKVSGRLNVDGDLKCLSMKVSGAATIEGNLTVVETTKISGSLTVNGEGKFGGGVKIAGKMGISDTLYFTDSAKIAGKVNSTKSVVAGGPISVAGKLNAEDVQSKSEIKVSGAITTKGDVVAEIFISEGGPSQIGGNLQAQTIEMAKRYREKYGDSTETSEGESTVEEDVELDSIADIGKFVTNLVNKIVPNIVGSFQGGNGRPPKISTVEGNVEGKTVDLSYVNIVGDVIGDDVVIGPGVTIGGSIKYKTSISVPENSEYKTAQN